MMKNKKKIGIQIVCMLLVSSLVGGFMLIPNITSHAATGQGPKVMVSLGDSYSSGEGIDPFYGSEQDIPTKVKDQRWLAHRSQKCWSGQLKLPGNNGTMAQNAETYWYFRASSGAVTDNMKYAQAKDYKKSYTDSSGKNQTAKGHKNIDPQLKIFDKLKKENKTVDYVTLTMGGNDIGFTDIITKCVIGSAYYNVGGLSDSIEDTWDDFYADGGIKDRIRDTYVEISKKAGPQANIIVAGYPRLFNDSIRQPFIKPDEAAIVNRAVIQFNQELSNIVASCQRDNIKISFVPVEKVFEGHGAYSSDPYINGLWYGAQKDDLKDFLPVSSYSIHPNAKGAAAYAVCVQNMINRIENGEDTTIDPGRPDDPDSVGLSPEDLKKRAEEEIENRKQELETKRDEYINRLIDLLISMLIKEIEDRYCGGCDY